MSEEEIIKYAKIFSTARGDTFKIHFDDRTINEPDVWKGVLDYIDKLQEEIEKYKRLAEANLKDVQEFQDNMCNHRCIKNNEVLELKAEIEKKDKVIDLMAEDIYDNDNFWKIKCRVERIEKGKEKDYIKERFFKKVEDMVE